MVSERKLLSLATGLLAWAIVATVAFAYYYQESSTYVGLYEDASERLSSEEISVSLLVKYDDGREEWHNNTQVLLGDSLLDLTLQVTEVEYDDLSFGAYVKSVGGVQERPNQNLYWLWWQWDDSLGWYSGGVGAEEFRLRDGSVLAWYLEDVTLQEPP